MDTGTQHALRKTPLHDVHVALNAKLAPFAGYEMPIQYSGVIAEHRAVREAAGLFDVSHMGEFIIRGDGAADFVQYAVTNDVRKLYPGRAQYTAMCHEDGGTIDDLIVYMLAEDYFMLVVNAANIEKDLDHLQRLRENGEFDCSIEDRSEMTALIALQGPLSIEIAEQVVGLGFDSLKYYHFMVPDGASFLNCREALISRTGYTGEIGLEIYCEADRAEAVWQALIGAGTARGLLPCGLAARDTLRLEAGFALYGHELSETISPLEAGLGWVVKLDKGDFAGRDALQRQKDSGIPRRLIGFTLEERGIPRQGYAILSADGSRIGEVTSGSQSPILGRGIGLALVENSAEYTDPGARISIDIRGKTVPARVVKPPFHKLDEAG